MKWPKPKHQPASAARQGERLAWISQTRPVKETTSSGSAWTGGSAVAASAPRAAAQAARRQPDVAPTQPASAASRAPAEPLEPLTGGRGRCVARCG